MTSPMVEEGLRERKRLALRATIESTALNLILEHGYEAVTVEMICNASMVSPRTFFNYFGSKEGVVLGSAPPVPSTEEIEKFVIGADSNVLADFVVMITAAFMDTQLNPEVFKARGLLIQRTPELFDRQLVRMAETEKQLVQIILQRFRAHGRDAEANPDLNDEARMIIALGMGVMRFVLRKRITDKFTGSSRELIDGSIALIKQITSNNITNNTQKAANV